MTADKTRRESANLSEARVREELLQAKLDNQQLTARIGAMGDDISRHYGEIGKAHGILSE